MAVWKIVLFPPSGQRNSPKDIIAALQNKSERAQIEHRLGVMLVREIVDWPRGWNKKITENIYRLRAGDIRVLFCFYDRTIIVVHVCRKKSRKIQKRDIRRAEINCKEYYALTKEAS